MARTAKLHRLTALAIKSYAEDSAATAPLHDGGGLYLRKRDASMHWVLRLTDPATGAQQWHRMFPDDPGGGYPHKSLADARAEARRLWASRSAGVDPRAERRRRVEADRDALATAKLAAARRLTIRALFDRWAATDLAPRIGADGSRLGRKDGGDYTRAQFERRVFPVLGDRAAEDVSRSDLLTVLDAAKLEGKLRTANVLLTDLKQMFRFALTRDLVPRNPLDTVTRRDVGGTPVERDRSLSADELPQLAQALPASGLQPRFVCAIWIVLATGVRAGELLGAVWSAAAGQTDDLKRRAERSEVKLGFVDLDRREWHLPETKNQRDHTIHLSDFACTQFQAIQRIPRDADDGTPGPATWIFPNAQQTGPINAKALAKQVSDRQREPVRRLKGRSKATSALLLPGGRWTPHDLRRTTATLMAGLGISGDVIDECLNHMIESRIRRTYVRDRRRAEQRHAFEALGRHLATTLQTKPAARRKLADRDPRRVPANRPAPKPQGLPVVHGR